MALEVQTGGDVIGKVSEAMNSPILNDEDAEIERLLSEKLLEGYILMERICPSCATPLVKNKIDEEKEKKANNALEPFVVPSKSFDQPFQPVLGVPFCVSCHAHVVTDESEISILEKCDTLKMKGQILVSLQSVSEAEDPSEITGIEKELDDDDIVEEEGEQERKGQKPSTFGYDAAAFLCGPGQTETKDEKHDSQPHHRHSDEKKDDDYNAHTQPSIEDQSADELMAEYSVRREIATKVLGAKMLQGYTLKETQCGKCGMPLMEYHDNLECVVCPALMKKARKKLKEKQRLAEQKDRMERKIQEAKGERALAEEADEHARLLAIQEEESTKIAALEAEEQRLLAEARARPERVSSPRSSADKLRQENDVKIAEGKKADEANRRKEELELIEETRRLEQIEQHRAASKGEQMRQDLLLQEARRLQVEKVRREEEIKKLEEARLEEQLEQKRHEEELRVAEEANLLESLEREAAEKAKAAEEAIAKAKAALATVTSARRDIIAQTIAMAEAEAIAEAEGIIKAEREDYKAPIVLPTKADLKREHWETLRQEGRSVMTRRVMAGWTLLAEFCSGVECENSPLLTNGHRKECVVCGGSGNGHDGVYLDQESVNEQDGLSTVNEDVVTEASTRATLPRPITPPTENLAALAEEAKALAASPTANRTVQQLQEDFESKRNMVSKEIGRRMIQGWTLLDASCPHCVMPLMADTEGNGEICVLCGLISRVSHPESTDLANLSGEIQVAKSVSAEALTVDYTLATEPYTAKHDGMIAEVDRQLTATESSVEIPVEEIHGNSPRKRQFLVDTIRGQVDRRTRSRSPMGDPPAPNVSERIRISTDPDDTTQPNNKVFWNEKNDMPKGSGFQKPPRTPTKRNEEVAAQQDEDVFTVSFPKDFDFTDEKAFLHLMTEKRQQMENRKSIHKDLANGTAVISVEDVLSKESIIKMFLESPQGIGAKNLVESGNMDSVTDLAEAFVRQHFGSDASKQKELTNELVEQVTTSTYRKKESNVQSDPEPELAGLENSSRNEDSSQASSRRRPKVTPESMSNRGRSRALSKNSTNQDPSRRSPSKPDAVGASRSFNLPPSPRNYTSPRNLPSPRKFTKDNKSPRKGGVLVIGGPGSPRHDDNMSIGEYSRAETVASATLDSILTRIEDCKATLLDPNTDVVKQAETAKLIEQLASAAMAVKRLETL